jgi:hypothetical protein
VPHAPILSECGIQPSELPQTVAAGLAATKLSLSA